MTNNTKIKFFLQIENLDSVEKKKDQTNFVKRFASYHGLRTEIISQ